MKKHLQWWRIGMGTLVSTALLFSLTCSAATSPAGTWRTYDLDGTARSIVRFYMVNNRMQAKILKVISPARGETSNHMAKPGRVVIWGLKESGDEWIGGQVLDTDTGNTYRCTVTVSPDNETLDLHAYVALPVLGKSVQWVRVGP